MLHQIGKFPTIIFQIFSSFIFLFPSNILITHMLGQLMLSKKNLKEFIHFNSNVFLFRLNNFYWLSSNSLILSSIYSKMLLCLFHNFFISVAVTLNPDFQLFPFYNFCFSANIFICSLFNTIFLFHSLNIYLLPSISTTKSELWVTWSQVLLNDFFFCVWFLFTNFLHR